jgi:hypothetical protein
VRLDSLIQSCGLEVSKDTVFVSFRHFDGTAGHRVQRLPFDGTSRFPRQSGKQLVLLFLEGDLELSALVLWDLMHSLEENGHVIRVEESPKAASLLDRRYWLSFLQRRHISSSSNLICDSFTKIAPSPLDGSRGMDSWSFCIPTGGKSSLVLNRCVERILSLNTIRAEILLCGQPAADFRFLDQVSLLPDHASLGRASISIKKNALATAASHPNLCILHDNLLLPTNFAEGMQRFGDDYGICGFQSVFFLDHAGLVVQRYADYALFADKRRKRVKGLIRESNVEQRASFVSPLVRMQPELPWVSARYYDHSCYLTGRIYVAKRPLWLMCPQNESIGWGEFEDVEHAERAMEEFGIPMRINPYCYTQTLVARNSLCFPTQYTEGGARPVRMFTPPLRLVSMGKWKPTLPISISDYRARLVDFVETFCAKDSRDGLKDLIERLTHTALSRLETISAILESANCEKSFDAADEFVHRFFADVVGEPGMEPWIHRVAADIADRGEINAEELLNCWNLARQSAHSIRADPFMESQAEILEPQQFSRNRLLLGIALSNLRFPGYYSHPNGLRGIVDAIAAARITSPDRLSAPSTPPGPTVCRT